jgi:plasmid maintenance system antidote protein VapI
MEQEYYKIVEAARKLQLTRARVYQLIDAGELIAEEVDGQLKISHTTLVTYLRMRAAEYNALADKANALADAL